MAWAGLAEMATLEREFDDLLASQKELCNNIAAFLAKPLYSEVEPRRESTGTSSRSYSDYSRPGATGDELHFPEGHLYGVYRTPSRGYSRDRRSEEACRPRYRSRSRDYDYYQGQDRSQDGLSDWQRDDHPRFVNHERYLADDGNVLDRGDWLDRDETLDRTNVRDGDERDEQSDLADGDELENEPDGSISLRNGREATKTTDEPDQHPRPAPFPPPRSPLESPRPAAPLNAAIGSQTTPVSVRNSDLDQAPRYARNTDLMCSTCGAQFDTTVGLKYHKPNCTDQVVPEKVVTPSGTVSVRQVCSYCEKTFPSRTLLFQHLSTCDLVRSGISHDINAAPDTTASKRSATDMLGAVDPAIAAPGSFMGAHEVRASRKAPTLQRDLFEGNHETVKSTTKGQPRRNAPLAMRVTAPTQRRSSSPVDSGPRRRGGRGGRGRERRPGRGRRR